MKRAISISELISKNFKVVEFENEWYDLIGNPQLSGTWLVWGDSGNGKTRLVLQLCKYLTNFGRVAYNSLEEGFCESMKLAFIDTGMDEVKRKIILLDNEPIEDLEKRLKLQKAPKIVVIDSIQYSGLNFKQYKRLKESNPKTLFIIISHSQGKYPAGRVANAIRFDAFVKIKVEGYKAFATSRFGGGKPYTIWREGAEKYWNKID